MNIAKNLSADIIVPLFDPGLFAVGRSRRETAIKRSLQYISETIADIQLLDVKIF